MEKVVAIDLGTSNCCVAVYRNNNVEVVRNTQGNRTTPSRIAFTEDGRVFGEFAQNACIEKFSELCNFEIGSSEDERRPFIEVELDEKIKNYTAEELSAMLLKQLKNEAENYLGEEVKKAVITVPACFNYAQRQATKEAGTIAGLEVIQIFNEPTAAAMAYFFIDPEASKILVYDFGGGHFSASVVSKTDRRLRVLSNTAEAHLGGEVFTNAITEFFVADFKSKHNKIIDKASNTYQRLRYDCEVLKKHLSSSTKQSIAIEYCGIEYSASLTRSQFNEMFARFFDRTLQLVQEAIDKSYLKKEQLDVVLIGGSTRIPRVQELLTEFFGKSPFQNINADEAVAYGAAIQAAIRNKEMSDENAFCLDDFIPFSLGISPVKRWTKVANALSIYKTMDVFLHQNSWIPNRIEKKIFTISDYQASFTFKIYEGEKTVAKKNHYLGGFKLRNLPKAPKGTEINVTFTVDKNSIVTVEAECGGRNAKYSIRKCHLPSTEIRRMMQEID